MKSIINSFICADHDPLDSYQPEDMNMFHFWVEISVGIEGEEGEDLYQVSICSQKWIEERIKENTFFVGLYTIIMQKYDYDNICQTLNRLFCIEGKNYEEIFTKLGQIGLSEYQKVTYDTDAPYMTFRNL